jgi:hypothetical protein
MPLSTRTTPANGGEWAPVIPRLDALHVRTGQRGRPRTRPRGLAADKGYEAKALRQQRRKRGLRARIPKRVWERRKPRGRPITMEVPRFQAGRMFAWFQKKYRHLVVRWERLSVCVTAFLTIAMIHRWMRRLIAG